MENFNLLDGSDTLKASRDTINNNLLSVRSLSSGTAFPTDNLSVGMLCYRTDLKRLYQYKEDGSWTADIAMSISGNANTANSAGSAANANHADTADTADTADVCTGNAATATALQTKRNINGVSFNGTEDINIDVGVKKINGVAADSTGNVDIKDYVSDFKIDGKTVTVTFKNGTIETFTTQDTTYSEATTSTAGLMSASDKTKLNGLGSSGSGVFYATCSTASGTAAKVATVTSGSFSLTKGVTVIINSTNMFFEGSLSSSSKTTLNVNSTGAKNIRANNGTVLTQRYSASENSKNIIMVYDGTYWMPMNCGTFAYSEASN